MTGKKHGLGRGFLLFLPFFTVQAKINSFNSGSVTHYEKNNKYTEKQ